MKNFFLRPVWLLAIFIFVSHYSVAQIEPGKIEQDIKYPCDTSSGGGTGQGCVHVCLGDTVRYSTDMLGTYKWNLVGDGTILITELRLFTERDSNSSDN